MKGIVRWFDAEHGIGIIAPRDGSADVVFMRRAILRAEKSFQAGAEVDYELETGYPDEPAAAVVFPVH